MMHPIVHHSLRVAQVRGLSFTHIMFDLPIYFSEQLLSFMYVVDIHFAFPLLSERSVKQCLLCANRLWKTRRKERKKEGERRKRNLILCVTVYSIVNDYKDGIQLIY
jgi:hypothetical protein